MKLKNVEAPIPAEVAPDWNIFVFCCRHHHHQHRRRHHHHHQAIAYLVTSGTRCLLIGRRRSDSEPRSLEVLLLLMVLA